MYLSHTIGKNNNIHFCSITNTYMRSTIVHKKRLWNVTLFPLRMKNSSNKIIKNFLSLHTKNSLFTNKTRHIWENSELLKMVLKIPRPWFFNILWQNCPKCKNYHLGYSPLSFAASAIAVKMTTDIVSIDAQQCIAWHQQWLIERQQLVMLAAWTFCFEHFIFILALNLRM